MEVTEVVRLGDVDESELSRLLRRYALRLIRADDGAPIPGSYWGESEAGLVDDRLYAREDTPVHSVLHEAAHFVCMTPERRLRLDRDAGGDDLEESAVCYLQVLLSDYVPTFSRSRLFADMDRWGYSFRLGSSERWFQEDAEDARGWLVREGVIDEGGAVTWKRRGEK